MPARIEGLNRPPEVSAQEQEKREKQIASQTQESKPPYKPTTPPMYVQDIVNPPKTQEEAESRGFYREVGQPQLAGKYGVPNIPSTQKIISVTEVKPEGGAPYVEVKTAPKEQPPKGIGEQIASFNPVEIGINAAEAVTGRKIPNKQEIVVKVTDILGSGIAGVKGTPTEFIGGAVSAVESPIYAAATAWGVKGLPQPPTVSGAIISSVLAGRVTEEYKTAEAQSPSFQAGSVAGDLLLFAVSVKGAQEIFRVSAKLAPVLAQPGLAGLSARAGLSAGLGATVGGLMSGGDTNAILQGALIGAGASVAVELGGKAVNAIRPKLPKRLGGVERLTEGPEVIGKTGKPVKTYVSENPLDELGGRRLEVVADVTKNPVGFGDVTTESLLDDYINRNVPTGHATLNPEGFDLQAGGKTVIKGIPSEAAGFRSEKELFHFYSAPGDEEFVTVYGGYAGIGKGYSETPKIVFGGKSAALVTTETPVSSQFLRQAGENIDDYLTRTSMLSGKTGIAQETLLGKSAERQLITPTKYTRQGVELPGSVYVSEGKVATFQIQQKPTGRLGNVPVVRSLLSDYTNITVYKGSYAPVANASAATKALNVQTYGASYGKVASLSRLAAVPSVLPIVVQSKSPPKTSSKTVSSARVAPKVSEFKTPSFTSEVSKMSRNASKATFSPPSIPSMPVPSMPSGFSKVPEVTRGSFPSPSVSKPVSSVPRITSYEPEPSSSYYSPSSPLTLSPSMSSFPSTPKALTLSLPSSIDWPKGGKPSEPMLLGSKLKVWKFPVLDPSDVLGFKTKKKRRKS